jgi:hypothetical protein
MLRCLGAALAFVAALVLLAIAPAVQTWAARLALAHGTGTHGTLGSISAGFGEVDVEDLHLSVEGTLLTLPTLQARLPLTRAVLERKLQVASLVAKGWTLDLSHTSKGADAEAVAVPASAVEPSSSTPAKADPGKEVARVFRAILARWKLPIDGTLDGVDLEGDVIVAGIAGKTPVHVHVVVAGGGIGPDRQGDFTFDADANSEDPVANINGVSAHGRFSVATDTLRWVNRLSIDADVSARSGPQDLSLSAEAVADPGAAGETYTLALRRGDRRPATFHAHYSGATSRLDGTWKVDLGATDLAAFAPEGALPVNSAQGEGQFDADASFDRIHAVGSLRAGISRLGATGGLLERVGNVALDTQFDLARDGDSIKVGRLRVAVDGAKPIAVVTALQPFAFDARSRDLKLSDPSRDWLDVSIRAFPLAWLSGPTARFTVADGDATGELGVRAENGALAVRPKTALTAAGVSLQRDGMTLCRGLDLSVTLVADVGPREWTVQWTPLAVNRAGKRWATIEGNASRSAGADQPVRISGSWTAGGEGLASGKAVPAPAGLGGAAASGEYSANLGTSTEVNGKVSVVGPSADQRASASLHADMDADGEIEFSAPIKVAFGANVSEISAEGTWTGQKSDSRIDMKLASDDVALEHLRWLAVPWAAFSGGVLAPSPSAGPGGVPLAAGTRDPIPFWGNWVGRVAFAFVRLKTEDSVMSHVDGLFDIGHGSIRLVGGQCSLPHDNFARFEGSLAYDGLAGLPYGLNGTMAFHEFDVASFYPAIRPKDDPQLEGRFTLAGTVSGGGVNLDDLLGRTQEKFQLLSTSGIVRFLRTSVAESIPEVSSPVSDTLGSVGSLAGAVFGIKGAPANEGKNPVSKTAEAVLDLTNQVSEIGCDRITVTAARGADGSLELTGIEVTAPDEHLKGSGQISYAKGVPIFERPLSMDLRFGARGQVGELLSKAGLLSPQADDLGYPLVGPSIHFGGTLEQIDEGPWHELLVKAATRKPEAGKKGG